MKINAKGTEIRVITSDSDQDDYISLTDIAKYKNPDEPRFAIQNWMRNRNTLEFLSIWEELSNPLFNRIGFEAVKKDAGLNSFVMTPSKWIESVNAIGIISKAGRYGGTYAHSDIAFEFASWISPEFKLYIIKDYQRLKQDEAQRKELGWDVKRELSKINYRIHTDAIKTFVITPELSKQEIGYAYANEADLLNVALFGKTAKQWREETGNTKKNMRDFASVEQLVVLINLESLNADLIRQNIPQSERLVKLRQVAYYQLESLTEKNIVNKLQNGNLLPSDK
ncbi:KilA-N domain-containing protein [Acetobacterium wieringae]|uniref:KilA-N domain-containing protein n=1 Tax=Acetobacterium wieringae TaxID=52694 RepID=UPI002B21630C|nr:KilA-N domain-containing protein [Acetobacterium wieringae]MEA4804796.1 KilA-N domain-containing protein [Acetobacterium wieringae]